MDLKEAAKRLGVTRNTIVNMAQRGQLRLIRRPYGRPKLYVLVEDIERLEKKQPVVIGAPVKP